MNKETIILIVVLIVVAFGLGTIVPGSSPRMLYSDMGMMNMDNMDSHRTTFLSHRDDMVKEMLEHGEYRCCLENPCTYCIEKTPGHGEGATCDCLRDVVEGRHPCGECIGEILEGHGNQHLSQYFAKAIAEEVGEHHIQTLREIIFEKYGVPIEEQL